MRWPCIKTLLLGDFDTNDCDVKAFLEKSSNPCFRIYHYKDTDEAVDFLANKGGADLILFDIRGMEKKDTEKIFSEIKEFVDHSTLILFTNESDHDFAIGMMDDGAFASVTKESFVIYPEVLRYVTELSLITKGKLDQFVRSEVKALKKIDESCNVVFSDLKGDISSCLEELEKIDAKVFQALEDVSLLYLSELDKKMRDDIKSQKEVISWMNGGYSVVEDSDIIEGDMAAKDLANSLEGHFKKRIDELKDLHRSHMETLKSKLDIKCCELRNLEKLEIEKIKSSNLI